MNIKINFEQFNTTSSSEWKGGFITAQAESFLNAVAMLRNNKAFNNHCCGDDIIVKVDGNYAQIHQYKNASNCKIKVEVHRSEELASWLEKQAKIMTKTSPMKKNSEEKAATPVNANTQITVATFNISVSDDKIRDFLLKAHNPDIVCFQECSWNSKDIRVKMMREKYVLLGQTRGGQRDNGNDFICLETYLLKDKSDFLVPETNDFRTCNCAHELLLSRFAANGNEMIATWFNKRRHHLLACKIQFNKKDVWILNIHLTGSSDADGFTKSDDYRWKWQIPEIFDWYGDKKVIVAGDWNFDAYAALKQAEKCSSEKQRKPLGSDQRFIIREDHKNGKAEFFLKSLTFSENEKPTHRFQPKEWKKGSRQNKGDLKDVRVDFVSVSKKYFKIDHYPMIGELSVGKHVPVIATITKS
jgi:exonuclease III